MLATLKSFLGAMLRWIAIALAALLLIPIVLGIYFRSSALSRERKSDFDSLAKRGHFVQVQDTRLFYQDAGPHEASPVVLFLPGTGAWSELWKPTMAALAKEGIRSLAVDLPPFGLSDGPRLRDYHPKAQGRRLTQFIDELGLTKVILVGHSLGGQATLRAALGSSSKLVGLVLVDIALGHPRDQGGAVRPLPEILAKGLEVSWLRQTLASAALHPWLTRTVLRPFVKDASSLTEPVVAAYQEPLVMDGASARVGDWLPEFLGPGDSEFITDPKLLKTLRIPTAILWGEADSITPLWQGRWLKQALPTATLYELKGVGHIPQIEDAPQFERTLLVFLKSLRMTAPAK